MTFTYVDPTTSDRDAVRLLLSDTVQETSRLQDSEIAFLLSEWNNDTRLAAAEGAEIIAGQFMAIAKETKRVGDLILSKDYSHTAAQYSALADSLRANRSRLHTPIVVINPDAALSTVNRSSNTPTTDFVIGQDDNPGGVYDMTQEY